MRPIRSHTPWNRVRRRKHQLLRVPLRTVQVVRSDPPRVSLWLQDFARIVKKSFADPVLQDFILYQRREEVCAPRNLVPQVHGNIDGNHFDLDFPLACNVNRKSQNEVALIVETIFVSIALRIFTVKENESFINGIVFVKSRRQNRTNTV